MGRYYYGDIQGKFGFGVQPSDSANRFGVIGETPSYLEYRFEEDHIEIVEKELKKIKDNLGDNFDKLNQFFEDNPFYKDKDVAEFLNVTKEQLYWYLCEFADYDLGLKILNELKENGVCAFNAELE
jgi:hypothetical protein